MRLLVFSMAAIAVLTWADSSVAGMFDDAVTGSSESQPPKKNKEQPTRGQGQTGQDRDQGRIRQGSAQSQQANAISPNQLDIIVSTGKCPASLEQVETPGYECYAEYQCGKYERLAPASLADCKQQLGACLKGMGELSRLVSRYNFFVAKCGTERKDKDGSSASGSRRDADSLTVDPLPIDYITATLARERWEFEYAERISTEEQWGEFLREYPDGPHAKFAKQHLAAMAVQVLSLALKCPITGLQDFLTFSYVGDQHVLRIEQESILPGVGGSTKTVIANFSDLSSEVQVMTMGLNTVYVLFACRENVSNPNARYPTCIAVESATGGTHLTTDSVTTCDKNAADDVKAAMEVLIRINKPQGMTD